jgi:4-hydroxy-3-methylbut-2-enyl diphosphate reductase
MKIILANPRGFCAGVNMAIESLDLAIRAFGTPIYVFHEIVHNKYVVETFRAKGAVFVDDLSEVPPGATLLFSAHGVSPEIRRVARERRLRAIDATCPLVTKVHIEAVRFAREGYTILLIGHEGHDETIGTMGEAPQAMVLVESVEHADRLSFPEGAKLAYLTQTTLSVDDTNIVVDELRARFPALAGPSSADICYATQNRQQALKAVARESDLVLVVGSENSSNSVRLVEVAEKEGTPARLIDDHTGLDPAWLSGKRTIGLTAGASAPERLVQQVIDELAGLGPVAVEDRTVAEESILFNLPKEVT